MKNFFTFLTLCLMLTACGKQATSVGSSLPSKTATTSGGACSSHPVGQGFASSDGCNTCSCDSSGRMTCTLMACGPVGN